MMKRVRVLSVAALTAVTAACAGGMGGLGDVLGGQNSSLIGEVRSIDARRGRIELREQYGRDYTVRFDRRTRVMYGQREYPVSSLERGDEVQIRVAYDRDNTPWAETIQVRDSRRADDRRRTDDRGDIWSSGRVQRVDGRVDRIDTRRGWFSVEQNRGQAVVVYMARDTRREDIRRFERLRRGERVRADVRLRGGSQAELVRFR